MSTLQKKLLDHLFENSISLWDIRLKEIENPYPIGTKYLYLIRAGNYKDIKKKSLDILETFLDLEKMKADAVQKKEA